MDKTYELLQEIRKRPELYIGKPSLERLYAFLNGYKHYEEAYQPDCLDGFEKYIEDYYNLNTDHNWEQLIRFFSLSGEEEAFNKFYNHLDNFLKSKA